MSFGRFDLSQQGNLIRSVAKILDIKAVKCESDWDNEAHAHPYVALYYIVGEDGQFQIDDEIFAVSKGDLVVVNPLTRHRVGCAGKGPVAYILLGIENIELLAGEEEDGRYCLVNFQDAYEDVLFCLNEIVRECEQKQRDYEIICQDLLEMIFVWVMRRTHYKSGLMPPKNGSKECAAVRRYIDAHFKENVCLDQLAQVAHVNKFHLAHAFSKEYGISPISYLNQRKIEESKLLLRTTQLSLARISQILGFSSPGYFSQSFRRHENMSPMSYRQKCKKGEL